MMNHNNTTPSNINSSTTRLSSSSSRKQRMGWASSSSFYDHLEDKHGNGNGSAATTNSISSSGMSPSSGNSHRRTARMGTKQTRRLIRLFILPSLAICVVYLQLHSLGLMGGAELHQELDHMAAWGSSSSSAARLMSAGHEDVQHDKKKKKKSHPFAHGTTPLHKLEEQRLRHVFQQPGKKTKQSTALLLSDEESERRLQSKTVAATTAASLYNHKPGTDIHELLQQQIQKHGGKPPPDQLLQAHSMHVNLDDTRDSVVAGMKERFRHEGAAVAKENHFEKFTRLRHHDGEDRVDHEGEAVMLGNDSPLPGTSRRVYDLVMRRKQGLKIPGAYRQKGIGPKMIDADDDDEDNAREKQREAVARLTEHANARYANRTHTSTLNGKALIPRPQRIGSYKRVMKTPHQMRKRPTNKVLYFVHIHKSGGTVLCTMAYANKLAVNMKHNCNVQTNQRCCGKHDSKEIQTAYAQQTPYDLVAAETQMYEGMDPHNYNYIVVLRKSRERYFSHWKHILREVPPKRKPVPTKSAFATMRPGMDHHHGLTHHDPYHPRPDFRQAVSHLSAEELAGGKGVPMSEEEIERYRKLNLYPPRHHPAAAADAAKTDDFVYPPRNAAQRHHLNYHPPRNADEHAQEIEDELHGIYNHPNRQQQGDGSIPDERHEQVLDEEALWNQRLEEAKMARMQQQEQQEQHLEQLGPQQPQGGDRTAIHHFHFEGAPPHAQAHAHHRAHYEEPADDPELHDKVAKWKHDMEMRRREREHVRDEEHQHMIDRRNEERARHRMQLLEMRQRGFQLAHDLEVDIQHKKEHLAAAAADSNEGGDEGQRRRLLTDTSEEEEGEAEKSPEGDTPKEDKAESPDTTEEEEGGEEAEKSPEGETPKEDKAESPDTTEEEGEEVEKSPEGDTPKEDKTESLDEDKILGSPEEDKTSNAVEGDDDKVVEYRKAKEEAKKGLPPLGKAERADDDDDEVTAKEKKRAAKSSSAPPTNDNSSTPPATDNSTHPVSAPTPQQPISLTMAVNGTTTEKKYSAVKLQVKAEKPPKKLEHPAQHTPLPKKAKPLVGSNFSEWWAWQPDNWNFRQICGTHCVGVPKYQLTMHHWRYTLNRFLQFHTVLFLEDLQAGMDVLAERVLWKQNNITYVQAAMKKMAKKKADEALARAKKKPPKKTRVPRPTYPPQKPPNTTVAFEDWDPLMSALDDALYDIGKRWEQLKMDSKLPVRSLLVTVAGGTSNINATTEPPEDATLMASLRAVENLSPEELKNFELYFRDEPNNHRHRCETECCNPICSSW